MKSGSEPPIGWLRARCSRRHDAAVDAVFSRKNQHFWQPAEESTDGYWRPLSEITGSSVKKKISTPPSLPELIATLNKAAGRSKNAHWALVGEPTAFGGLKITQLRLGNGLKLFVLDDNSTKVLSYHTWFAVGSRHEHVGKTGLAHLFEHLMFNETKNLPAGTFDRQLESIGASSNAATWNDWTYYHQEFPAWHLATVIQLEAERMQNLVLRVPQVTSEKEVVANERRYRVDDDVDGTVGELLYKLAFEKHPYHHPTIGWMSDIEGFTTADCRAFYQQFYSPNNATLVVVGNVDWHVLLSTIQAEYGVIKPSTLPAEPTVVEGVQKAERVERLSKPTPTARVAIGYKIPGMNDPDHIALTLLAEVLLGGQSSRWFRALVLDGEVATDVGANASPFRDPGLFEIHGTARNHISADQLLAKIDELIGQLGKSPINDAEVERALARFELGFLQGLQTVGGRAEQIGFYQIVLNDPAGSLSRLTAMRRLSASDLQAIALKYLKPKQRTMILVQPDVAALKALESGSASSEVAEVSA